ncbi:MAG: ABC transporter permease [Lachnospiraceae bacterium]|nr:ABC transporter permease [Lachnospiraceae bacterium]MDD3616591.1 ABC transporter permease [Lachnospiraceae bacterium]
MNFFDLVGMSWGNLRRRKLRTCLTVLGVVIGTASIVVMLSLGLGLQNSMYAEAEQSGGLTSITVATSENSMYMDMASASSMDSTEDTTKYLTDSVLDSFKELPNVTSAAPVLSVSGMIIKGNYQADVQLLGMKAEDLEELNLPLVEGNYPAASSGELEILPGNMLITNFYDRTSNDYSGYWGSEDGTLPDIDLMNDNLFFTFAPSYNSNDYGSGGGDESDAAASASNQQNPTKYIMKSSGKLKGEPTEWTAYAWDVYCNLDNLLAFMKKEAKGGVLPGQPTTKAGKALPNLVYSRATVKVAKPEQVMDTMDTLRNMGYEVTSNMEYIESAQKQMAIIQLVLGAIGAVSLLVAAIGIMNTMMMSIYERTKEIGVMKVLGCGLNNIRQMFLWESGFIGLLGGIIGNILSFLLSLLINQLAGQAGAEMGLSSNISYIPMWLMLASLVFAVFIGMLAGYIPARKAMKLSPLNALAN